MKYYTWTDYIIDQPAKDILLSSELSNLNIWTDIQIVRVVMEMVVCQGTEVKPNI